MDRAINRALIQSMRLSEFPAKSSRVASNRSFLEAVMGGSAHAFANDPWIGKFVITRIGTALRVENGVVDDEVRTASLASSVHDQDLARVYRVECTNGEWLWLKGDEGRIGGWVRSGDVIPY